MHAPVDIHASACSGALVYATACAHTAQVVPLAELEAETVQWCREMVRNSPTALRALKAAMNAAEDGQAGIQELGHNLTLMFYHSEEADEGRRAYLEKRPPDFSTFPRLP